MTQKQILLVNKAKYLNERIKQLNMEIQLLQKEYINVSNELYDSVEAPKKLIKNKE